MLPEPHRPEPHDVRLATAQDVPPQSEGSVWVVPDYYFRADRAKPVDGIDYDAFWVKQIFIQCRRQYREPRPARELFLRIRRASDLEADDRRRLLEEIALDTCQPCLKLSIDVVNRGDRTLPFAIDLAGRRITVSPERDR